MKMAYQNKEKSCKKKLEGAGRKPLSGTLENALMEWILERREKIRSYEIAFNEESEGLFV